MYPFGPSKKVSPDNSDDKEEYANMRNTIKPQTRADELRELLNNPDVDPTQRASWQNELKNLEKAQRTLGGTRKRSGRRSRKRTKHKKKSRKNRKKSRKSRKSKIRK